MPAAAKEGLMANVMNPTRHNSRPKFGFATYRAEARWPLTLSN